MLKILQKHAMSVSILVFFLSQIIKPLIVIAIYKTLTNFHPTVVNNYEIYLMVWEHITQGSMKGAYTALFVVAEIAFIALPFWAFKTLLKTKATDDAALTSDDT